jgi:cytochrome c553
MRTISVSLLLSAAFFLSFGAASAGVPITDPEPKLLASCQQCHGVTGNSESPHYPRLNGQQPDYLMKQLYAFRDRKRDDTHARVFMWSSMRRVDDKNLTALAVYFSRQKPTQPQTGGALAAEGGVLFADGEPRFGLIACRQCHGKAGEGDGVVPRIAGQHAAYLRMILGAFRSGSHRELAMSPAAKPLVDHHIEALASFLSND